MTHFEPPIHWADHEDIAQKLYERFGDEFNEGKIYRIRFTDLLEWILQIPNFEGKKGGEHGRSPRNDTKCMGV
jgi:FeS assembly protein IscX